MKVILEQTVQKLGKAGQVVTVADGFARNFLFPKRLARVADKAGLARLERAEDKVKAEVEKGRDSAVKTAEKLSGTTLRLVGQTAKGNTKLFGAITSTDIAEALKKESGVSIDKKAIALLHPIKRLGVYDVMIDLHRDADATIKVEVANEEGWLGVVEPLAKPFAEPEVEENAVVEEVAEVAEVIEEPPIAEGEAVVEEVAEVAAVIEEPPVAEAEASEEETPGA